jgi:hypothetical protein
VSLATGKPLRAASLLAMTERDAEDLPPELVMALFRTVQEYMVGLAEGEAESAGHQVTEALGLGVAAITAAVTKLREEGWVNVGRHVMVGPDASVSARHVIFAERITVSESATIVPLEDIRVLTAKASRKGIAGLTALQVFTLVVVWLLAASMPVAQQALPPEAQAILANEYGTIGLGLAITSVILTSRRN